MKALERIFLYSVLAILVFYVFLVDNKVESQVAIQEEIRARSISIVNDEGREVVMLWADEDGGGMIGINNKAGTSVVYMGTTKDSGIISIYNKAGIRVATMGTHEYGGGMMGIANKDGTPVAIVGAFKDDNGLICIYNKYGKVIGSLP